VHQDEAIWLADHSPPVKLCVSLSDVDCFHSPQLQCTSRSTVLHFVEALDCYFGVKLSAGLWLSIKWNAGA